MRILSSNGNIAILSEIGERIKRARIDQRMTQQEFAKKAGVSNRAISMIENGGDFQIGTLINLMRALGYLENINNLLPELAINPEDYASIGKQRQRVSTRTKQIKKMSKWKWGDET